MGFQCKKKLIQSIITNFQSRITCSLLLRYMKTRHEETLQVSGQSIKSISISWACYDFCSSKVMHGISASCHVKTKLRLHFCQFLVSLWSFLIPGVCPAQLTFSLAWIPWNLSFRYIHCTGQFTPKMKANSEPRLLSSLVWIDSGVVMSQHCLESFFKK